MASKLIPVGELLSSTELEVNNARKMMNILINVDHKNFKGGSISYWSEMLSLKQQNHRYTLPLGQYDGVEYYLAIEHLGPCSLNSADVREGYTLRDTLVDVTFTSETGEEDERRAIPVGRIIAARNGYSTVFQSRWIVLCDQNKSLWACYARDTAPMDLEALRPDYQTRRYYQDPNLDNILGAVWSKGQCVVYLGKLDQMQFQMIELNSISVETASWKTYTARVFNNGDFGQLIHPVGFQRLRSINVRHLKHPNYKQKDFVYLADTIGYEGFRADLNHANRPLILGRQVTEAAYLAALLGKYIAYDAAQLSERFPGMEMRLKKRMLFRALDQRSGFNVLKRNPADPDAITSTDDVEAYWKKREKLSPGLDIAWIPNDQLTADIVKAPEEPEDIEMGEADAGEQNVSESD